MSALHLVYSVRRLSVRLLRPARFDLRSALVTELRAGCGFSLAVRTLRLLLFGSALITEFRARLKLRTTLNARHGLRRDFELRAALVAELDSASVGRTALRTLDGRSTDATTALLLL